MKSCRMCNEVKLFPPGRWWLPSLSLFPRFLLPNMRNTHALIAILLFFGFFFSSALLPGDAWSASTDAKPASSDGKSTPSSEPSANADKPISDSEKATKPEVDGEGPSGTELVVAEDPAVKESEDYFAIIDGQTVSLAAFKYEYQRGIKQAFYHGKIAADELEDYRKRKVNQLVLGTLLAQEATRRGLKVPDEVMKRRIDALDKKNSKLPNWPKNKDRILGVARDRYEDEELVKILKDEVINIKRPGSSSVEEYYSDNLDQFTAPEQWRISLILLLVDPSSPGTVWDETLEKAADLVERIRDGENFAEFARIHSGDPSAVDGGDMGYMHIGMLAKPAQEVLNIMRVGETSEPVILLKGVSIFKLEGVLAPKRNKFEKVEDRATNLLIREKGQENWLQLKKTLKANKEVVMNSELEKYFTTTVRTVQDAEKETKK